ncbi:MAG TPA: YbhB/YbcL family Raf kinase inhibitor-like protein [Polyangia bacterium]|jgi:hypothetical protein
MRSATVAALVLALGACTNPAPPVPAVQPAPTAARPAAAPVIVPAAATSGALRLTSPAFAEGQPVPKTSTCDAGDRSPALAWSGAPPGTRSFALILDDPDAPAGTWVHWIVFGIPADRTGLPEGAAMDGPLRGGANSWGKATYGGPCPPPGAPHRYVFRLFALDVTPDLAAGASRPALEAAMRGHILAEATMMGRYGRQKK